MPLKTRSHKLIGYWNNWVPTLQGTRFISLTDPMVANYDVVMVAFADITSFGSVTFTPVSGYLGGPFANDIAMLQSQGKTVLLSVGGATGPNMKGLDSNTFATSVCNVMKKWGFQGIDIDLETTSNPGVVYEDYFVPSKLGAALTKLKGMTCGPAAPIITLTPQTLDLQSSVPQTNGDAGAYLQLLQVAGVAKAVNWVQTQVKKRRLG